MGLGQDLLQHPPVHTGEGLWLWLLVTWDRLHVTPDTLHMTRKLNKNCIVFSPPPDTPRDSVAVVFNAWWMC